MKKRLKCVPLIPEFDKFIRASASGRRRKSDGNRISPGTIETYRNCRKILVKFSAKYGEPTVYTGLTVNKGIFRVRTRYWKQTLFQFTDYLRSCKYCETYIWNNQKILRALMHHVGQQYGWPDAGFAVFRLPRLVQPEPLTLSVAQLQELIVAKFGASFKENRLALVRDLVITGCLTALRYGDLMTLRCSNLIEKGGNTWMEVQSQKTGIMTRLLLPQFLIVMLRKYRKLRKQNIFPGISNVNLNKQIKKLGHLMGWCDPTQVIKSRNGILKIERVGKFYELLTTHTMRRTGITILLQLGMPEHLVRQISGHAPNSKEFYRYVKIAQNWQDDESQRVYKLIAEQMPTPKK
jgi:integrase